MGRMNFLIVLGTLILKIPLGGLKKVEFHDGLMPIFCGSGRDLGYSGLHFFRQPIWIGLTMKTLARAKVRARRARLALGWLSARFRSAS